jgi:hypothetical protein
MSSNTIRATVLLGHSATLHSHAKPPPHFVGLDLCCAKPLFGPPKRRQQPKRYAPFFLKLVDKINIKEYNQNYGKL